MSRLAGALQSIIHHDDQPEMEAPQPKCTPVRELPSRDVSKSRPPDLGADDVPHGGNAPRPP
eukprot:7470885-Pyramimonas_sp.AAC.1